ncbi:MAG: DMT family transporter [Pseudomonadota bacterium]
MTADPPTRFAENLRGAGFMSASMFGFACNDAIMKFLAPEMGLFQAILIRSLFALALVAALAWRFGALGRWPPRRDLPWMALRSLGEIGATAFYLSALMRMPMGNVSAIVQSLPLVITLFGALFLGERVGWRRWSAVLAGFAGVLMIVRPGGEAFDPASGFAFAAMLCFLLRDLATRQVSGATPSLLITLVTTIGVGAMGGIGAAWQGWTPVDPGQFGGLALAALFIFAGYFGGVMAMREGEIGFISPFRYAILVWSLLLGFLVFDERPDALTLLGAATIVGAGLYAFWRERRAAQTLAGGAVAPHAMAPGPRARR